MYFGKQPAYINNFPRDILTGDGVKTVFDLTRSPPHSTSVLVFVGGVPQFTSYTTNGFTITFSTPPAAGVPVVVVHLGVRGVIEVLTSNFVPTPVINTTSGTYADYTTVPLDVNRIIISISGVSISASPVIMQLGTAASIETTGYAGAATFISQNAPQYGGVLHTTGFIIDSSENGPLHGKIELARQSSSNLWTVGGSLAKGNIASTIQIAGSKLLSDTLTKIRLTSEGGAATFSAGSFNVIYE